MKKVMLSGKKILAVLVLALIVLIFGVLGFVRYKHLSKYVK